MKKVGSLIKNVKVASSLIVLVAIAVVFGGFLGQETQASDFSHISSSRSRPVFLYASVVADGHFLYLGEDTKGRRYTVENSGHSLIFPGDKVHFVRIASNDGQWYIKEILDTPKEI